jgi:hypothetical protein
LTSYCEICFHIDYRNSLDFQFDADNFCLALCLINSLLSPHWSIALRGTEQSNWNWGFPRELKVAEGPKVNFLDKCVSPSCRIADKLVLVILIKNSSAVVGFIDLSPKPVGEEEVFRVKNEFLRSKRAASTVIAKCFQDGILVFWLAVRELFWRED